MQPDIIPSGQLQAAFKAQALKHSIQRYGIYGQLVELKKRTKAWEHLDARRFVCAYLRMASDAAHEIYGYRILSYPQIARWIGRSDHTTAMHSKRRAYELGVVTRDQLSDLVAADALLIADAWSPETDWSFVADSDEDQYVFVNGEGWVRHTEMHAALLRKRNREKQVRLEVVSA